jgi:hypothetical protein
MRRSRRVAVAAVFAGLALASFAVVAVAHTVRFDSKVTIGFHRGHHAESDAFNGKVSSQQGRCERARTVAVKRRLDGPDALVGTDVTNRDGEWKLEVVGSTPAGTYYARARRKVLRATANHLHVCKPAVSNDLKVKGKP